MTDILVTQDRDAAIAAAVASDQPVIARALLYLHQPMQDWFNDEGDRGTDPNEILKGAVTMLADACASMLAQGTDPANDADSVRVVTGNFERVLAATLSEFRDGMERKQ